MINTVGTILEITTVGVASIIAVTIMVMFLFASVKVIKGLSKEL